MKITTTSGHTILADDADGALLAQYSWYVVKTSDGRLYAQARDCGNGKRIKMHRLLMAPPKTMIVHHRNNDGLDNRRANLEVASTRQNTRYHFEGKETGIHFHKRSGKWRAQLRGLDGTRVSLGMYGTRDAALAAINSFKADLSKKIAAKEFALLGQLLAEH